MPMTGVWWTVKSLTQTDYESERERERELPPVNSRHSATNLSATWAPAYKGYIYIFIGDKERIV